MRFAKLENRYGVGWLARVLALTAVLTFASSLSVFAQDESTDSSQRPLGLPPAVYDFTGDGRTDFSTINLQGGIGFPIPWKILRNPVSGAPFFRAFNYGLIGDTTQPGGDFIGDAKWDIAVWRNGFYYLTPFPESGAFGPLTVINWGIAGDSFGRDGDYNGDGKDDLTAIRNVGGLLLWYMRSGPGSTQSIAWGRQEAGFTVFTFPGADFNGDGRDDVVIARVTNANGPISWFVGDVANGSLILATTFGNFTSDFCVAPDDYTGDGLADIVVWRGLGGGADAGAWYIRNTATSGLQPVFKFGIADPKGANIDMALRGDYDGDGIADIAVFRPGTQQWFWRNSSDGLVGGQTWGAPGDTPLPSRFVF